MKHQIKIKATGDNASGKSFLLRKIKGFLGREGFKIKDDFLEENHEIVVLNEH